MREGLIVNVEDSRQDRFEYRDQQECFTVDGTPVWEVWFWHKTLRRWFVMTCKPDPRLMSQGVVCFTPGEVPDTLRARLQTMGAL